MRIKPNSKTFKLSLGERGEMIASHYLSTKGYEVLEKNYRCSLGEIDIIVLKKGRLSFVEVKTRTDHHYGRPEESVHQKKQEKLTKLAQFYLKEKKIKMPVDFSVVAVTLRENLEPYIRLIENAFEAQGNNL